MSQKQTFNEVELRISEAGDEFANYMLLKAAARLAKQDEAKKTN